MENRAVYVITTQLDSFYTYDIKAAEHAARDADGQITKFRSLDEALERVEQLKPLKEKPRAKV